MTIDESNDRTGEATACQRHTNRRNRIDHGNRSQRNDQGASFHRIGQYSTSQRVRQDTSCQRIDLDGLAEQVRMRFHAVVPGVRRLIADLAAVGVYTFALAIAFLHTGWPAWAFYLALIGGIVAYVTYTSIR